MPIAQAHPRERTLNGNKIVAKYLAEINPIIWIYVKNYRQKWPRNGILGRPAVLATKCN